MRTFKISNLRRIGVASLLCVVSLCILGCQRPEMVSMSYDSFGDLSVYSYNEGIIISYQPYDSFHAVSGHRLSSENEGEKVNYQVVLLGASSLTRRPKQDSPITTYYLPEDRFGYYIQIDEYNHDKDKIYYFDEKSGKQYLLEFRERISKEELDKEAERVKQEVANISTDLSRSEEKVEERGAEAGGGSEESNP